MKSRFFLVALLVTCLILILGRGVAAQGDVSNIGTLPKFQSNPDNANSHGDYINTLESNNIFLPLILNNYQICSIAPTLISPSDGSNIGSLVPSLTFELYNETATFSTLKVDDNDSFDSPITYSLGGGSTGEITLMLFYNLDPATTYYWYVYQTCDTTTSPASSVFSFTTGSDGVILPEPTLLSPSDGSIGIDDQTIFSWDPVPGAIDYQFWLCTEYGGCFIQYTTLSSTKSWLQPDTDYNWSVNARNDYAYGNRSAIWKFSSGSFTSSQVEENEIKKYEPYFLFHSVEGSLYASEQ